MSSKRQQKIDALKPKPPPVSSDPDEDFLKDLQQLEELQKANRDLETMHNFMNLKIEVEEQAIRENYWDLVEFTTYKGLCMTRHIAQQHLQAQGQRQRQRLAERLPERPPHRQRINFRQARQNYDGGNIRVLLANIEHHHHHRHHDYRHRDRSEEQSDTDTSSSTNRSSENSNRFVPGQRPGRREESRQEREQNLRPERIQNQNEERREESISSQTHLRMPEPRQHRTQNLRHIPRQASRQQTLTLLRIIFGPVTPFQHAQPELFARLMRHERLMTEVLHEFNALLDNQQFTRLYAYFLLGQQHQGPMTNVGQILNDPSFNPNVANQIVSELFRDFDVEQILRNVVRANSQRMEQKRSEHENIENERRDQNKQKRGKEEEKKSKKEKDLKEKQEKEEKQKKST